jgi:hypothetical protein
MVRWQELIQGLLSYGLWERPEVEHPSLVTAVRETNRPKEREVSGMVQSMAEHLLEQGEARGQVKEARAVLLELLQDRFGTLPEALVQAITASTDYERLRAARRQVSQLAKPEDLKL